MLKFETGYRPIPESSITSASFTPEHSVRNVLFALMIYRNCIFTYQVLNEYMLEEPRNILICTHCDDNLTVNHIRHRCCSIYININKDWYLGSMVLWVNALSCKPRRRRFEPRYFIYFFIFFNFLSSTHYDVLQKVMRNKKCLQI